MTNPYFARVLLASLLLSAIPAFAVNRTVAFAGPTVVRPGSPVHIVVTASTDAGDGEQVGFLHSEYSLDGGKTWTPVYADKLGATASRPVDFKAGADGTVALVRTRTAFRGGKAGDVDYTGAPIAWDGSWGKWGTPPAKVHTVTVTTR